MKYNYKLDHYQNSHARQQHWMNTTGTNFESLNECEKVFLQLLNELLCKLEDKFYSLLLAKRHELVSRVNDPSDWLQEFNLEFVITFYLREDDPEYEEDDDNILQEIHELIFERFTRENVWGFGATEVDHAEPSKFSNEKHCYLYHQLYDHSYLDWRDLLRIGSLYVDIKIDEQSGMLPVSPIKQTPD